MRIEQLDVVLRARSQWEAMELGMALVRRHAGAIWKPWLLLTLPLLCLFNLLGWWLDNFFIAALAMWWFKPAFERIPLYVISRAAFGDVPSTWQTLRAQWQWGWRGTAAYLGWRRLSPARSLLMPMDLLEGGSPTQRGQRRRVLGSGGYAHASLLTVVCAHFELMLQLAGIALIFMFVPFDLLPESYRVARAMLLSDTQGWAFLGFNVLAWMAMSLIAPFFSGAGFGLYLNSRTALEAWDIEITFRRLRERLGRGTSLWCLLLAFALPTPLLRAQEAVPANSVETAAPHGPAETGAAESEETEEDEPETVATPKSVFSEQWVDTAGFRQASARAYEDPQLGSSRRVQGWEKIQADPKRPDDPPDMSWAKGAAALLALLAEWALWIVVGLLVLGLLLSARWWLPWLRGGKRHKAAVKESEIEQDALLLPEALPPDVITQARALWRSGKPRHALALLYRASVETMSQRSGVALPPGATEAQCLLASRRMPVEADRVLFAQMVKLWQYAAYAGRLPDEAAFEQLLSSLQQGFGWTA
jgi:hypothetical protein